MCEKNGPDSPSGLARTARSARLRFCLFRRFVFYTRRMLVSASAASRLVQDKHTPKCQMGLNIEINHVVFEGLYNYKIIQMIDNLCKMCVLYSRYKLNFKNEGTFTLVIGAFFAIHSLHS